ncbi:hypothetical protein F511_39347 [Dorcoceras hygrometricum]|uniref:Uncharacterized protein n=1 Tax=Dorcoceras hygrometricum TaxID=472368 RepID=A0A2Z7CZK2_9LAMI|nr:hypothetical protein F511_39347 [Dorcoceras hygrometricum]
MEHAGMVKCRVSMTFRVVRTNQYNQDLGLIHSTNGNHLESPNEGSSIDHQSQTKRPEKEMVEKNKEKAVEKKKEKAMEKKQKETVVVVKKPMVARSQSGPDKSNFWTSSYEDTCPLANLGVAKKVGAAAKRKLKKQRTKRTNTVLPTQAAEAQAVAKELPIVVRVEPKQPAQPSSTQQPMTYGGGMVFSPIEIREIHWSIHFPPKIEPIAKGKKILEEFARPNPVDEHCLLVIQTDLEAVSLKMSEYDEWARFRSEVRLNTIHSMTPITDLAKVKDEFIPWTETELVFELLKKRMLVQCKLYEMEMKKKADEHRDNFNPATPSANYDHMCIWFLDHELKEMIKQHRAQRHLAGLPLLVPDSSVTGWHLAGLPLLVPESSVTGWFDDIPQLTWTEGRITSNQGTTTPDQAGTDEKSAKAVEQKILAIENRAQKE